MPSMTVTRNIAAPPTRVFDAVSDVTRFAEIVPHILKVEFV